MSRDFLDIYIFIAPVQARYRFFLAKIIITTIFNLRETTGFERKKNYVFRLFFVVFKAWKGVMVNIWLARNLFFLFFCGLLGSPTSSLLVFYGICGYSIAVYYSTWMPSWLPIQPINRGPKLLNNECSDGNWCFQLGEAGAQNFCLPSEASQCFLELKTLRTFQQLLA